MVIVLPAWLFIALKIVGVVIAFYALLGIGLYLWYRWILRKERKAGELKSKK